ncbi:Growth-regulating factor [Senna tora]|uniref:Growth-regulating factor n=1 Tax=Senna tora TaxID=362788 RepID=A0A834SKP0_9FABA|nr:Growth-regulating factor [Senna tora]
MRIRKRQPLFPLPSFSPLPLSDPHSPLVQLNHLPPPLSHHPLPPIPNPTHASDDSPGEPGLHHQHAKQYGLKREHLGLTNTPTLTLKLNNPFY